MYFFLLFFGGGGLISCCRTDTDVLLQNDWVKWNEGKRAMHDMPVRCYAWRASILLYMTCLWLQCMTCLYGAKHDVHVGCYAWRACGVQCMTCLYGANCSVWRFCMVQCMTCLYGANCNAWHSWYGAIHDVPVGCNAWLACLCGCYMHAPACRGSRPRQAFTNAACSCIMIFVNIHPRVTRHSSGHHIFSMAELIREVAWATSEFEKEISFWKCIQL